MPSALEQAIDALSDPAVSVADALRRLLVVSRRIDADELSDWLRSELNGYHADDETPTYRAGRGLPITLRFDGPMNSSENLSVTGQELPPELGQVLESIDFREPVAELEALSTAAGSVDPELSLSMGWITRYRDFAREGKVPRIDMMVLNRAGVTMPRTHLRGILDRVKSTALDLALSLEDVSPDVGTAGGPTVGDEPRLAREVTVHLTQLFAPSSTITVGDNAAVAHGPGAVAVQLQAGDVAGLLQAAKAFLDEAGIRELDEALRHDGGEPRSETRRFLDRVKSGGYVLAGGIGTNAAYDGLLALLKQVFPGTVP